MHGYVISSTKIRDIITLSHPNFPWWRHQLETFSALLAICAGNSLVPGEFPAQRPVTRSFDVFFDFRLNKRLRKQSWGWWFETPSRPLWRHRNGIWLFAQVPRHFADQSGGSKPNYPLSILVNQVYGIRIYIEHYEKGNIMDDNTRNGKKWLGLWICKYCRCHAII